MNTMINKETTENQYRLQRIKIVKVIVVKTELKIKISLKYTHRERSTKFASQVL